MGGGERNCKEPTGDSGLASSPLDVACILQCSHCKRIYDSVQGWMEPAGDPAGRAGLKVSNGLCPDCLKRHFPEFS